MKVQINNHPVTFELESEETIKDVINSISKWASERGLVFLETQIDEKGYTVSQVPDISLDDVELLNCIVQSRADVVISSLNEGISYCERVLIFIDKSINDNSVDLSEIKSLANGIEWLIDVLKSILQMLDVDIAEIRYKDRSVEEYTNELLDLKNVLLEFEDGEMSAENIFSGKTIFESYKNIFKMILLSENLKALVISSIDSPDLLIDSLNEITNSIDEQIRNLEDTAIAFQTGKDSEGSERLNLFVDFMFRYIRTCLQISPVFGIDLSTVVIDNINLENRNRELHELLGETVNVMENNDIISLTDILEYEIKPLIENLGLYLGQIQNRIAN